MPRCDKCPHHPEMSFSHVVQDRDGAKRMYMNMQMRRTGHPTMALIGSVLSGAITVGKFFFESVEYKCPVCGATQTEVRRKT